RHKVCEVHSKTAQVSIGGQKQRFCQQCSRFHSLEEFDEGKRSCRKRLDGHNRRRFDTYFSMARGNATVPAMEMTKWFDTNYHFIVPELGPDVNFTYASHKAVDEYKEAKALGVDTVPVLVGPVTYLLLS
ncbi:hypothetical protein P7M39_24385, partial [Vibrio parahaemolyticus]|nr:hypothetical protein [Vibrio parahaemolyticus]